MELVGRDCDLAELRDLAAAIEQEGRAVEVRGDPGVGKSAVLLELRGRLTADGWRVFRSEGVPTEHRLPLAGLHKLLRPVLPRTDELHAPQRDALETAFGLREGNVDFFRIALASLELLSRVAADGPLAVLVDDAHWLDRASAEVLAFVARRLSTDPVFLVISARPFPNDPFEAAGLPVFLLRPLDDASARLLLERAAPHLSPPLRDEVLAVAAGNPLALLELPRTVRGILTARAARAPVTLSTRLERAFADRVADLPMRTRDLLLLCAVNDSDRLAEALVAAESLTGSRYGIEDLDPALGVDLVRLRSQRIEFRHPLVRSALVQGSPPGRRQAAHAALAKALRDDPDRFAWHRAESTVGPDEGVAADLAAVADRSFRRGSALGAVDALERSATLSATSASAVDRLLRAAEIAREAGRDDLTRKLLGQVSPLIGSTAHGLRYAAVEEFIDERMYGGAERVLACVQLADEARDIRDVDLALRFLTRAAARCWHLDFGREVEQQVLEALHRLPLDAADPRVLLTRAQASPLANGPDIARALARRPLHHDEDPGDVLLLGFAAACVGDSRQADSLCARAVDGLRGHGRLALLAEALSLRAWAALRRGHLAVVEAVARECADVAADIGQSVPHAAALAALAAVAGIRGEEAVATELADRAERLAVAGGNTIGLAVTQVARGLTAATAGRSDEAFEHLVQLCSRTGRAHQRMQAVWALGSFAEAAVQTGKAEVARSELEWWQSAAPAAAPPGVDLAIRHARAALAPTAEADEAFGSALTADWTDRPFEHGRVLLSYGQWLRRSHRVTESRSHLRAARDAFARADARPWADRAIRELRAAGEGSRTPPADVLSQLSPQELQIARLVVEGLGNKEIGQRLYLSHRTVGSHLYRMFPKLGVSSRAQLVRLLAPVLGEPPAASPR